MPSRVGKLSKIVARGNDVYAKRKERSRSPKRKNNYWLKFDVHEYGGSYQLRNEIEDCPLYLTLRPFWSLFQLSGILRF